MASAGIAQAQGLPIGVVSPPPPPPLTAAQVQTNQFVAAQGAGTDPSKMLAVMCGVAGAAAAFGLLLTRPLSAATATTTGRTTADPASNPNRKYAWLMVALSIALGSGVVYTKYKLRRM